MLQSLDFHLRPAQHFLNLASTAKIQETHTMSFSSSDLTASADVLS